MLPGRKGEIYQYTDNDFKILLIPNTQWYQRTNETLLVSPIQKKELGVWNTKWFHGHFPSRNSKAPNGRWVLSLGLRDPMTHPKLSRWDPHSSEACSQLAKPEEQIAKSPIVVLLLLQLGGGAESAQDTAVAGQELCLGHCCCSVLQTWT